MSIRIGVDLKNPGQVFACCGALELANRLWPDACVEGAFSTDQFQVFGVAAPQALKHLVEQFIAAEVT